MHPNMRNFTAEYVYREFPKWVELANGEKILVHNADEEAAAIGPEETPGREALFEEARSLGLNPHHRTGEEKLVQMIKDARGE